MRTDITAIISFGGTRTAYILEKNRHKENPGEIDYEDYLEYSLQKIQDIILYYFQSGGQNLILEALDVGLISGERSEEYKVLISQYMYYLAEKLANFYKENDIDVIFIGIDAIQKLPKNHPAQALGEYLEKYNATWQYDSTRRKVIWNVAAMPLYSLHQTSLNTKLEVDMHDLIKAQQAYYDYFVKQIYGFVLPMPDLYIGSNRTGDYHLNTRLPIAIGVQYNFRLFFVPFPTFFMKQIHFDIILSEMDRRDADVSDYAGQISQEDAKRAYEHYSSLSEAKTIFGLFKDSLK